MTTINFPKWVDPPVHPAADLLPMVSDAELDDLAEDIKAHGLQQPIILWRDNRDEAKGKKQPEGGWPVYLLDGRNRLAALKRLGITDPREAPTGQGGYTETVRTLNAVKLTGMLGSGGKMAHRWETDCEPLTMVITLNIKRRHMTKEMWAAVVTRLRQEAKSARQISRITGLPKSTVADIIRRLSESGQLTQPDKVLSDDGRERPASMPSRESVEPEPGCHCPSGAKGIHRNDRPTLAGDGDTAEKPEPQRKRGKQPGPDGEQDRRDRCYAEVGKIFRKMTRLVRKVRDYEPGGHRKSPGWRLDHLPAVEDFFRALLEELGDWMPDEETFARWQRHADAYERKYRRMADDLLSDKRNGGDPFDDQTRKLVNLAVSTDSEDEALSAFLKARERHHGKPNAERIGSVRLEAHSRRGRKAHRRRGWPHHRR